MGLSVVRCNNIVKMIISNQSIVRKTDGSIQFNTLQIPRSAIRSIYIHMGMKGTTPQERYIKILLQNSEEILISCENDGIAKQIFSNLSKMIREL